MDGRFIDAFTLLPKQQVVCGRETRPLCLRHRIVLIAVKSPFVDGSRMPTPTDVIVFSKIISSTNMSEMMQAKPSKDDFEWFDRMSDEETLVGEIEKCLSIINNQSLWPVFWENKKGGKSGGAPWVMSVICNLVRNGVSMEEAWTMPESQAIWMNAVFSINRGAEINIVSEEDRRAMEQLRELEKSMASGKSDKPVHPRLMRASQN